MEPDPHYDRYTCKAGHHWKVPVGKSDLMFGLEVDRTLTLKSVCLTCWGEWMMKMFGGQKDESGPLPTSRIG